MTLRPSVPKPLLMGLQEGICEFERYLEKQVKNQTKTKTFCT